MFGKKILILVPHADDEAVGYAASIGRAQAKGSQVFALYLSHGCIAREALWSWDRKHYETYIATRRREGEEAARFLGITPVGWSPRPARFVWRELPAVYRKVAEAVEQHGIDQLWVPAYEGGNADHDGANAVASLFCSRISVLEFAEYNFANGKAHSQQFPHPNGKEQIVTLTPQEKEKKQEALKIYQSEQKNLGYVKTDQECWRPLESYDYSQPPHEGTLWYARFQWVPFRHPRVDFTKPAEVSTAITALFKQQS